MLSTLTLPPEYDNLPLTTRLWLQSRVRDPARPHKMIAAGQTRPVTVANVRIALDLAWLMAPRCWQAIMNPDCKEIRRWVAAHVASLVVEAVVPAAQ